jgi:hypothetical protein
MGGAALIIDYGGDHLHGDSFRVIRLVSHYMKFAELVFLGFQKPQTRRHVLSTRRM